MNGTINSSINDDSDRHEDEIFDGFDEDIMDDRGGDDRGFCQRCCDFVISLIKDLWYSSGLVINNKLNWLLIMGPVSLFGSATGFLGEMPCFAFSGIALIPCAERLSFVTEQVAMHTNGTIGALLNATFGNAPELLIASAALRKGYYRVVQLAMLGSMLTNLLFVFGISCLIGGLRWQVQELRITSGNVNVGMLLLSTAGSLLPATLVLAGQLKGGSGTISTATDTTKSTGEENIDAPTFEELQFCRVNAFVMIIMYGLYLIFQLGTHKEEFDEEENVVQTADDHQLHLSPHFTSRHGRQHKARRNVFCMWLVRRTRCLLTHSNSGERLDPETGWIPSSRTATGEGGVEMIYRDSHRLLGMIPNEHELVDNHSNSSYDSVGEGDSSSDEECLLPQNHHAKNDNEDYFDDYKKESPDGVKSFLENSSSTESAPRLRRKKSSLTSPLQQDANNSIIMNNSNNGKVKKKRNGNRPPGSLLPLGLAEGADGIRRVPSHLETTSNDPGTGTPTAEMSFRVGILWLFIITLGISVLSDILVDTIDGFASRLHFSEVFTSMIIVPFFSNVAEQVSAILFAYRNEMDLCVGVTVGSAIQVASFVLPGCVIIGWLVDRSMTLYFHAYETVCLFLAVVVVAAVLQGGTTNWLVGATCISVYIMIATGFWFHSLEDLSIDAETVGQNATRMLFSTVA